jgi:hypothetical protein
LQNGAPDGLALVDNNALQVLSALSYAGSITAAVLTGFPGSYNLVNGTSTRLVDSNLTAGMGLSRLPNGVDTHNDIADWKLMPITPGYGNNPAPVPEPATAALWLGALAAMAGVLRRRRDQGSASQRRVPDRQGREMNEFRCRQAVNREQRLMAAGCLSGDVTQ